MLIRFLRPGTPGSPPVLEHAADTKHQPVPRSGETVIFSNDDRVWTVWRVYYLVGQTGGRVDVYLK